MEAHVVIAIGRVDQAADQMLAGVLLHEVEAPVPVEDAVDRFSHRQGAVTAVIHRPVPLPDVQHGAPAQDAEVAGLAAALGIKGRAVQHHVIAALCFGAAEDLRVEFPRIGGLIVQFDRLHAPLLPPPGAASHRISASIIPWPEFFRKERLTNGYFFSKIAILKGEIGPFISCY